MKLPLCGLRVSRRLELLNGPALVVRGRRRHVPPPTLYGTAVHGEIDLSPASALVHLILPGRRLSRRSQVLGDLSRAQFEYLGHEARRHSTQAAIFAACSFLGLPTRLSGEGARVVAVQHPGPAAGALSPGDVLVAVDGHPVSTAAEAAAALSSRPADGAVELRVSRADRAGSYRDGAPQLVRLALPAGLDGRPRLGVRLTTHRARLDLPLDVDVELDPDSSGPSSGLMLTLALLDVLTPGSLTGGRRVAGTGTIGLDGRVGPVDWVDFKARAATRARVDLMLVPAGNLALARAAAGPALEVVAADSVAAAVDELVRRGGDRPRETTQAPAGTRRPPPPKRTVGKRPAKSGVDS